MPNSTNSTSNISSTTTAATNAARSVQPHEWLLGPYLFVGHTIVREEMVPMLPPHEWEERPRLDNADTTLRFVLPYLDSRPTERLLAVYLDATLRVLGVRILGEGTDRGVIADMKGLVRSAADTNAFNCILAHNHPGGSTIPSREDLELTEAATLVCSLIGVDLVDHVIVGPAGSYYSFAVQQPRLLEPVKSPSL